MYFKVSEMFLFMALSLMIQKPFILRKRKKKRGVYSYVRLFLLRPTFSRNGILRVKNKLGGVVCTSLFPSSLDVPSTGNLRAHTF